MPLFSGTVVIALDRSQTDSKINGWRSLQDATVPVCFVGGGYDNSWNSDFILAMSRGLSGDDSLTEALQILEGLYKRDRLILSDGKTDDPFALAPICVLFDFQAQALIRSGREIEIISPHEGTLIYTFGLMSSYPLTINSSVLSKTLAAHGLSPASASDSVDHIDEYNNARMSLGARLRREVYGTHWFTTADGSEHVASWLFLIIVVGLWGTSIVFRIVHPGLKKTLGCITVCLAFWPLLRILKLSLLATGNPYAAADTLSRLCWYLYYIPLLFVPLMLLYSVWMMGRSPDQIKPPAWFMVLAVFGVVFFLLTATNDCHRLIFTFDTASTDWEGNHAYGYLGYAMYLFEGGIYALFIALLFRRQTRLPDRRRMALSVVLGLALPVFLVLGMLYRLNVIAIYPGDMTFTTCLLTCLFCESCLLSGAFPSNAKYIALFTAARVWMRVLDHKGSLRYLTVPAQENGAAYEQYSEHYADVPGGIAIWRKDLSAQYKLAQSLEKSKAELDQQNSLLRSEQAVGEELRRMRISDDLLRAVLEDTDVTLTSIHDIVETVKRLPTDSDEAGRLLLRGSVLALQMKQKSELSMRERESHNISWDELKRRMEASAGIAQRVGIHIALSLPKQGAIPAQTARLAHDAFCLMIEAGLDVTPCDLAYLASEANPPRVVAFLTPENCEAPAPDLSFCLRIEQAGGSARSFVEDDTLHFVISLPGGDTDA